MPFFYLIEVLFWFFDAILQFHLDFSICWILRPNASVAALSSVQNCSAATLAWIITLEIEITHINFDTWGWRPHRSWISFRELAWLPALQRILQLANFFYRRFRIRIQKYFNWRMGFLLFQRWDIWMVWAPWRSQLRIPWKYRTRFHCVPFLQLFAVLVAVLAQSASASQLIGSIFRRPNWYTRHKLLNLAFVKVNGTLWDHLNFLFGAHQIYLSFPYNIFTKWLASFYWSF